MSFKRVPLSLTQTRSVKHNDHSFSTTIIRQFNTPVISTKNVSPKQSRVQHKKSSVQHTRQFDTKAIFDGLLC